MELRLLLSEIALFDSLGFFDIFAVAHALRRLVEDVDSMGHAVPSETLETELKETAELRDGASEAIAITGSLRRRSKPSAWLSDCFFL